MTWFRVGGAGIPATLKNAMNAVFNKKFGTSGQNYPPKQWPDDVNLLGPLPEGTASGSIANFSDGADAVPCKNVVATIAPTLDGVSSVDVVNCGKNLYDVDGAVYNGEFYDASGNIVQYADCAVSWIKVNPSTQYSFSCTKETSQTVNVRIAWCKSDKSFISRQGLFSDNQFPMTLTTPINCEWVQLSVNQYGAASIEQNNWNIQVEKSNAATTFEPYSGTTHTANLGRTIYGGSADLVNGELSDQYIKYVIDGVNVYGYLTGSNNMNIMPYGLYIDGTVSKWVCDAIPASGTNFGYNSSQGFVFIRQAGWSSLPGVTDASTFNSYCQQHPITMILPLETPNIFSFDGQEIDTLYGENNFWNDAGGDTTVVYRRDIELALQAVSSSRGLMMASRPVTQLVGEESDPDQVNELVEDDENDIPEQLNEVVENDETEQEGENDAR